MGQTTKVLPQSLNIVGNFWLIKPVAQIHRLGFYLIMLIQLTKIEIARVLDCN